MVLGNPPPELKVITPFVQRAKELTNIYPLISYYCLLQAANDGIKENVKTKECHNYLKELFDELELRKKNLSTEGSINSEENMAKAKLQITNLALNSFKKADDEDRSGNATKKTARTFHASSTFFEVLQCFGDLDEDIEKKIKYAKWKAADIMKAIREGRTPVPGSPGGNKKDNLEDELPSSSNEGINLNDNMPENQNINTMNDNFGRMNINDNNYNNMSSDPTEYNSPQQTRPSYPPYGPGNNDNDELNNLMNEMSPTSPSMQNNYQNNMNNMNNYNQNNMNNMNNYNQNNMNNMNNYNQNNMNNMNNYNQNDMNNMNNYNQNYNNGAPALPPRQQMSAGGPNYNNNNGAPMLPPRQQGGFDDSMFPSTPTNKPDSNYSSNSNLGSTGSMNNSGNQSPYNTNSNGNNNSLNLPTVPKNTFKEDPFANSNSLDEDSYSDDEIDYPYDPAVLMDAQKHSRFAISALQYDDVQTAIKNLRIALNLLEPYQNIQQKGH
ncbi:DUF605-domain-containing protein [Anaeromyces robustus]|uniref:DUF605-domain-containing protein n=1 Tax=Anaeromyces robustus TaxID=1754192 RepID=A0A1Y1WUY5_9FUNG|nr:DUF605-domain-containing protein [Anaeromyces robustus]|eukprot:ORX77108.1 DUF605-domain-containing protein [Anaeromyces robustus]